MKNFIVTNFALNIWYSEHSGNKPIFQLFLQVFIGVFQNWTFLKNQKCPFLKIGFQTL